MIFFLRDRDKDWPLLSRPIVIYSTLDNFDSSLRSSFYLFTPFTRRLSPDVFMLLGLSKLAVAQAMTLLTRVCIN